ncbi:MAG: hypothetical protein M3Y56_15845 [Armatimonadota bacterium]|nr:hypothetical protein [Armatimonadota bacterium]
MPATLSEVQEIIREEFPNSIVDKITEENHRIGGIIEWPQFQDMDGEERNRLVTEKVRGRLGLRGLNVGFLFPRAPGEAV